MKALFTVIAFCTSIAFAQEQSSPVVQNDSSQIYPATVVQDDELIVGDDVDIIKAQQQNTVAPSGIVSPKESSRGDKISADGELRLDGGEESLFDTSKVKIDPVLEYTPSVQESSIAKKSKGTVDSTVSKDKTNDDAYDDDMDTFSNDDDEDDDDMNTFSSDDDSDDFVVDDTVTVDTAKTETPKIEKTSSINFARNLKEYRSPKVAMLLSLFVPGAGQVYAKHNSWKAAIYGAVEVGMIVTSVALRFKGNEKETEAHNDADSLYSYDKYHRYQNILGNNVADTVYNSIFLGGADTIFQHDAALKNSAYYSTIKEVDLPFVHGWDDVKPQYDDNMLLIGTDYIAIDNPDSSYLVYPAVGTASDRERPLYGFSEHQKAYRSDLAIANSYYRNSGMVLTLMLVNHIVSAIDAGFSAKAHNDHLLGKESFWDRIELNQMYVSTGSGIIPGYSLKVRF